MNIKQQQKALTVIGVLMAAMIVGIGIKFAQSPKKEAAATQSAPPYVQAKVEYHRPETVVTYREFEGMPVQLVIAHDTNRVILRIKLDDKYSGHGDRPLEFLKTEVEGITDANGPVELGRSGMSIHLKGLPIWGPHHSMGPDGHFACLYFGDDAKIDGKKIHTTGEEKPTGYWPYRFAVK